MKQSMLDVAGIIKNHCIEAARQGFLDASESGLCREGAIEAAISAIQNLDIEDIINHTHKGQWKINST